MSPPVPSRDASTGKTTHVNVHTDVTIGFKHVSTGTTDPTARVGLALLAAAFAYAHRSDLAAYAEKAAAELRRMLPPSSSRP